MTNAAVSSGGIPVLRRAVVIVNERAPNARSADWTAVIAGSLGPDAHVVEVRVLTFEEATAAARRAADLGVDVVIAVGGDGTVNACLNGIAGRRTELAVIPAGTANDLARQIGQKRSPSREAASLHRWKKRRIDAINVNGVQFCSVGGVGWVADAANLANRWRARGAVFRAVLARIGSLVYSLACMIVILAWRRLGASYSIRYIDAIDDQEKALDLACYGILVANFRQLGKSFVLAPDSAPADGIFEIIVVPRTTRWRLIRTVIAATRGRLHDAISEVKLLRVRRATIESDRPMTFFGDGETLVRGEHRLELDLADSPLRLIGPASVQFQTASPIEAGRRV